MARLFCKRGTSRVYQCKTGGAVCYMIQAHKASSGGVSTFLVGFFRGDYYVYRSFILGCFDAHKGNMLYLFVHDLVYSSTMNNYALVRKVATRCIQFWGQTGWWTSFSNQRPGLYHRVEVLYTFLYHPRGVNFSSFGGEVIRAPNEITGGLTLGVGRTGG